MAKSVVKVAESDLPELRKQLLLSLPKSARVAGAITNVLKGKLEANFYTDKWPDFSAVVSQQIWPRISEVADIAAYATSSEALTTVLTEGNLITWGKPQQLDGIEGEHADYLIKQVKCADEAVGKEFCTLYVCYTGVTCNFFGTEKPPEMSCPEGFFLDKLEPHHVSVVSQTWPYYHDMPHREEFLEYCIKHYESVGLFSQDDPTLPISFLGQIPGGVISFGFTDPKHRGKGYYSIVKNEMCRAVLSAGYASPNYDTFETVPPPRSASVYRICDYKIKTFLLK